MRKKNLPPKKATEENRSRASPEPVERALNWSLKYLSYRSRSTKEIKDYLSRKNVAEQTINATTERLLELKFLNDEEFARGWIESRQKHKGKSKFILKRELRLKGLSDDVIEPLLKVAQDDLETARILFEKKKRILGKFPPEEFKKKMTGFLQSKGFNWGIISKLLKEN